MVDIIITIIWIFNMIVTILNEKDETFKAIFILACLVILTYSIPDSIDFIFSLFQTYIVIINHPWIN